MKSPPTKQASKVYPSIWLPKEYGAVIRKNAEIIPTSHEGKQAFLVVVDHESLNSESVSPLEQRVEALEEQLKIIKETAPEEVIESGGPDEIRTHDPRRVKAMS